MASVVEEVFKQIKEQTQNQGVDEVEELVLDSIHFSKFTSEIKAELEKYPNLLSLSMNDCALKSLENFPVLPKLLKLEIIDNKLSPACIPQLLLLKQLQSLSLGGNQFNSYEEIKPLTGLENLIDLDLFGCKICEDSKYRQKIYEIFPNLMILDNCDKDGKEVEDEDDDDDEEDGDDKDDEDGDEVEDDEEYDEDEDDVEDDEEEDDDEDEDDEEAKAKKAKKAKK